MIGRGTIAPYTVPNAPLSAPLTLQQAARGIYIPSSAGAAHKNRPAHGACTALLLTLLLQPHPGSAQTQPSASPAASPPPGTAAAGVTEARECFRRGHAAYVAGDLARALAGFLCAYRGAPSPDLQFNIARVYERMGEADAGIAHYRAYLEETRVTPRERKRIHARIQALLDLRERQRAVLVAPQPSLDALSAEARTFYQRGVKLFRAQQYEAAISAFGAALQLSAAPELHFNLAVASERLNRRHDALDHYRAYLAARSDAGDRDQIEARIAALQLQRR